MSILIDTEGTLHHATEFRATDTPLTSMYGISPPDITSLTSTLITIMITISVYFHSTTVGGTDRDKI